MDIPGLGQIPRRSSGFFSQAAEVNHGVATTACF